MYKKKSNLPRDTIIRGLRGLLLFNLRHASRSFDNYRVKTLSLILWKTFFWLVIQTFVSVVEVPECKEGLIIFPLILCILGRSFSIHLSSYIPKVLVVHGKIWQQEEEFTKKKIIGVDVLIGVFVGYMPFLERSSRKKNGKVKAAWDWNFRVSGSQEVISRNLVQIGSAVEENKHVGRWKWRTWWVNNVFFVCFFAKNDFTELWAKFHIFRRVKYFVFPNTVRCSGAPCGKIKFSANTNGQRHHQLMRANVFYNT